MAGILLNAIDDFWNKIGRCEVVAQDADRKSRLSSFAAR